MNLHTLTLSELKAKAQKLNVTPQGDRRKKTTWLAAIETHLEMNNKADSNNTQTDNKVNSSPNTANHQKEQLTLSKLVPVSEVAIDRSVVIPEVETAENFLPTTNKICNRAILVPCSGESQYVPTAVSAIVKSSYSATDYSQKKCSTVAIHIFPLQNITESLSIRENLNPYSQQMLPLSQEKQLAPRSVKQTTKPCKSSNNNYKSMPIIVGQSILFSIAIAIAMICLCYKICHIGATAIVKTLKTNLNKTDIQTTKLRNKINNITPRFNQYSFHDKTLAITNNKSRTSYNKICFAKKKKQLLLSAKSSF